MLECRLNQEREPKKHAYVDSVQPEERINKAEIEYEADINYTRTTEQVVCVVDRIWDENNFIINIRVV